ncbi:MAG: hypothetical protein IPL79_10260 [Myxococcales bacterium]|nr:hypothetical protein [Myxococcales bacterium]
MKKYTQISQTNNSSRLLATCLLSGATLLAASASCIASDATDPSRDDDDKSSYFHYSLIATPRSAEELAADPAEHPSRYTWGVGQAYGISAPHNCLWASATPDRCLVWNYEPSAAAETAVSKGIDALQAAGVAAPAVSIVVRGKLTWETIEGMAYGTDYVDGVKKVKALFVSPIARQERGLELAELHRTDDGGLDYWVLDGAEPIRTQPDILFDATLSPGEVAKLEQAMAGQAKVFVSGTFDYGHWAFAIDNVFVAQ